MLIATRKIETQIGARFSDFGSRRLHPGRRVVVNVGELISTDLGFSPEEIKALLASGAIEEQDEATS